MMMRVTDSSVGEKCLDPQLWHACAGGMVQMPAINSKVFYCPQGHAEHAHGSADFRNPRAPALILCKVAAIRYMADHETDDVYAKITLLPVKDSNGDEADFDNVYGYSGNVFDNPEKPTSFVKTLTQSDANNGGGFSVPRYCAETIFPRLDYSVEPPVQAILAKDVHGETWKFRHIYRGTPRRHLLTTGWSNFVNQKKLVAGDSIVFLTATESGDLCVGVRRAKKGIGGWHEYEHHSSWNPKGRAEIESAVEAAANGEVFEVVYYPRGSASSGSTPEFCVRASAVRTALQIRWSPGMRFKMPFETEDSSRISWFMGTISCVQVSDPVNWPDSPWRLLQVAWDEPDLLQNVKRVNPWLVELVVSVPAPLFSPPRKRPRVLQYSPEEFPLVGIQEARHNARFGPYQQDLHFHHPSLYHPKPSSAGLNFINILRNNSDDDISCWLRIGHNPEQRLKDEPSLQPRPLLLFGQVILTQDQLSNTSANLSDASNSSSDASGGGRSPRDDLSGCVKVDEPFSEFLKTATRLGILTEPHSDTAGF